MFGKSLQAKFVLPVSILVAVTTLALVVALSLNKSQDIENAARNESQQKLAAITSILTVTDAIVMERVKGSMKLLMERGKAIGPARQGEAVEVNGKNPPELFFGTQPQANHFDLVDGVTATQGGTATLFSRAGDEFVRVSTNVKRDGKRAIGTVLDPKGKAIQAIREGQAFYGQVDILGNPFLTGYEPIFDAQKKAVGVWYVGYKIDMQSLQDIIAKSHILEGGFVALVDDKGAVRFHSQHVTPEVVKGIVDGTSTGWELKREKFAPWGFEMVAAYPRSEVSNAARQQILMVVGVGVVLGGVLLAMLAWLSNSLVIQPLREANAAAERIAQGDLKTAVRSNRGDEIGTLLSALGNMQEALRRMIGGINGNAQKISELSATLSRTASDVAAHSEQQSDVASTAAAAVEELSSSIEYVTQNTSASLVLTQEAGDVARRGGEIVEKASQEMRNIAGSVDQSSQRIRALGEHSVKISSIANVIKEIADQTNLLALNAAIEAARAGEQGRGFAVVADEVRKLAERTGVSTKEISDMIAAIQSETDHAVGNMEEGQARANTGVAIASEAGVAMSEICSGSEKVVSAVNDISSSLREQAQATVQLSQSVQNIAAMSEKNASAVQSVAQAANQLRDSANSLQSEVARFRI